MSIEKLQQDILRCQYVVIEITIKHYEQDNYKEIVMKIFKDILGNYFSKSGKIEGLHADDKCPDKIEPNEKYKVNPAKQEDRIPEEHLKTIRAKYGLGRSEN